jgi:hypothetical protein
MKGGVNSPPSSAWPKDERGTAAASFSAHGQKILDTIRKRA